MSQSNGVHSRGLQAMILAAGLGSRLKPWTDHHPKALAIVNGKSLLERNVIYLQKFGITDVIVNVHHFADQILQAIDASAGWGSKITISDETDTVLETGGGLKKAASFFNPGPFVLMNVDVLTNLNLHQMISHHQRNEPVATLAVTNRVTSRYFLFNDVDELCGWRNVKTGEEKLSKAATHPVQKAFSGIHIIDNSMLSLITQEGKFSMVDVYLHLAKTQSIKAFDHSASKFVDVGKPESITAAEQIFA